MEYYSGSDQKLGQLFSETLNLAKYDIEDYISEIEKCLGKKAIKEYLPLQPGDVMNSLSDISKISEEVNYSSSVSYKQGIANFIDWYTDYYSKR